MTQFYQQYKAVKPWLVRNDPMPEQEILQSPQDPRQARRPVRVHPVRLLLDLLPVVLVESGEVSRAAGTADCLAFSCRLT